jgi:hypothetical protein
MWCERYHWRTASLLPQGKQKAIPTRKRMREGRREADATKRVKTRLAALEGVTVLRLNRSGYATAQCDGVDGVAFAEAP